MKISLEDKSINITMDENEFNILVYSIVGESAVECVRKYPNNIEKKGVLGCVEEEIKSVMDVVKNLFKESKIQEYVFHEINGGKKELDISTEEMVKESIFKRKKYLGIIVYSTVVRKIESEEIKDHTAQAEIASQIFDEFMHHMEFAAKAIFFGVKSKEEESESK